MTKAEGGALKGMRNTWMHFLLIPLVRRHLLTKERRQILIQDYILKQAIKT